MKNLTLVTILIISLSAYSQNHDKKSIRFIFESVHDHLGNKDINSKRVQLFSKKNELLYEADLYEGNELDEQFFFYDKEGKLLRDHRIFSKEHESGDYRMTYDAKGNLIEETNVDDIEEVLERKVMTYNVKNQMITKKVSYLHKTTGESITESDFSYTYDDNGELVSRTGYENEKPDVIVTYKYSKKAGEESEAKYDAKDQLQEKWTKKYNEKGQLISDVHTLYEPNKAPVSKTIDFTYDEFGHVLTEVLTKSNSTIKKEIIFNYVYDEYGNWLERTEKKIMGAKHSMGVSLKREIEYYEDTEYHHPPMELDHTFNYVMRDGKEVKALEETHVRINNNFGEKEWVVRRNGSTLYVVDEYHFENNQLVRINHLNNEHTNNAYTTFTYEGKNVTEKITYSHNGEMNERTFNEYDDQDKIVKKEQHFESATTNPVSEEIVQEYHYNDAGKMTEIDMLEYGTDYKITLEYNDKGQLVKRSEVSKDKDEDKMVIEYTYDSNGKLATLSKFNGNSKKPYDKAVYKYDASGEMIQSAHYKNDKLTSEVDYIYFE
ncbi:hypothetical protein K6119_02475 [Paracrocinitomix mangrovi]|uniref:RHS repeat domain-containing protein n=1 Tax=Paracrocinitomix mangrovi TaxID=2862509 RepID=UPI001C8DD33B|nr:hypothetical protein [Paracrocinitomix mangrovi]UKN02386.1 hypothetical protein K6119_02475 [Paracrocinitomix mangrovi]